MGFDWSQFGQGAAASAASGAIGGLFGLIGARSQRKQQEKLMAKQFAYDTKAFAMENARQDFLLKNSALLQKQGLERAGYSTADPEGTGFQLAGNNTVETPAAPSAAMPFINNVDVAGSMSALASAKLANSQAALNEIESRYRAQKLEGEISRLNLEIDQKREAWPTLLETMKQDLENKVSSGYLTERQAEKTIQETENLRAALQGIKLSNKYDERTLESRVDKVSAEVAGLLKDNRIKEAEAKLADVGILLGADGITMLLSALYSGNADEIVEGLANGFSQLLDALPSAAGTVIKKSFSTLKGLARKGWNKAKNMFN